MSTPAKSNGREFPKTASIIRHLSSENNNSQEITEASAIKKTPTMFRKVPLEKSTLSELRDHGVDNAVEYWDGGESYFTDGPAHCKIGDKDDTVSTNSSEVVPLKLSSMPTRSEMASSLSATRTESEKPSRLSTADKFHSKQASTETRDSTAKEGSIVGIFDEELDNQCDARSKELEAGFIVGEEIEKASDDGSESSDDWGFKEELFDQLSDDEPNDDGSTPDMNIVETRQEAQGIATRIQRNPVSFENLVVMSQYTLVGLNIDEAVVVLGEAPSNVRSSTATLQTVRSEDFSAYLDRLEVSTAYNLLRERPDLFKDIV